MGRNPSPCKWCKRPARRKSGSLPLALQALERKLVYLSARIAQVYIIITFSCAVSGENDPRSAMQQALLSMLGQPQQERPVKVDMAALLEDKGLATFLHPKVPPVVSFLLCLIQHSFAVVAVHECCARACNQTQVKEEPRGAACHLVC